MSTPTSMQMTKQARHHMMVLASYYVWPLVFIQFCVVVVGCGVDKLDYYVNKLLVMRDVIMLG